jgi:hypothetical protein
LSANDQPLATSGADATAGIVKGSTTLAKGILITNGEMRVDLTAHDARIKTSDATAASISVDVNGDMVPDDASIVTSGGLVVTKNMHVGGRIDVFNTLPRITNASPTDTVNDDEFITRRIADNHYLDKNPSAVGINIGSNTIDSQLNIHDSSSLTRLSITNSTTGYGASNGLLIAQDGNVSVLSAMETAGMQIRGADNTAFMTMSEDSNGQKAMYMFGTPYRTDGATNSLGCVVSGPVGVHSRNLSSTSRHYHTFKVMATNATNHMAMGVGDQNYNYEPWIAGAYDNSTPTTNDFGNKDIRMQPAGGNVTINGNIVTTSDDRVKVGETLITDATTTLLKLTPQTYTKYALLEETDDGMMPNGPDLTSAHWTESGLIAQDVYYDAPELRHLINHDDRATPNDTVPDRRDPRVDPDYRDWGKSQANVNYTGLIAYLVKSICELHERIAALESLPG